MSESKNQLDQAQVLRERMNTIQNSELAEKDTLSLPPRKSIHHAKDLEKKTKFKLKYPIVRLLALLFVLLPIAILGYTYHQNNQLQASNSLSQDKSAFREEILIGSKQLEETIEKEPEEDIEENSKEQAPAQENADTSVPEGNTSTPEPKPEEEQSPSSPTEIDKNNNDIVFHTVKEGETLYSISQAYYSSRSGEEILKKWNDLSGNKVENGQVLEIPAEPKDVQNITIMFEKSTE